MYRTNMLMPEDGAKEQRRWREQTCFHFSICACHPCAGTMLIFSVSFQCSRMIPKGNPEITNMC